MIRINLLAVERERTPGRAGFQLAQKVPLVCSLVLVATGVLIAWWYWTLSEQSSQINQRLASAETEAARLQQLIGQVQQFEQRRSQIQERVALIEQLRKGQAAPVHMLDEISRSLPEGLWLTELRQQDAELAIVGRCLALTALTDFAENLEASGYFARPVDIVESQAERSEKNQPELIKFTLRASFAPPGGG